MNFVPTLGVFVLAYLIGAIPFGYLIVKFRTGSDIRDVQSGRTGGTNAMRAAGFGVGFLTAILDIFKGLSAVMVANYLITNPSPWILALSPVAAIMGHNYSIFLAQRGPNGKVRLGGGAGGATCLGGSLGLWAPSGVIIFIAGALIFYFVGYASVATISIAALSIIIFSVRGALGLSPWAYALYGVFALSLLLWSLRPNLIRLKEGTERLHGFRSRKKKVVEGAN